VLETLWLAQTVPADAAPLDSLHWSISIVNAHEPGQRMIVTGRLFDSTGKTPRAGVRMGVYQTDARGFYGATTLASPVARLHGWLRTDSLGRYEIRTIRPGAYPGGGTPAHIHFIVGPPGRDSVLGELRFEDDPLIRTYERERWRSRGTFGEVRPVTRDRRGILHVVRDFQRP